MGKTGDFATKKREFLHKAPCFPDLLARRKAAWEAVSPSGGVFHPRKGLDADEGGKEGSLPQQKIPLTGRGCAAKGIYSKCAARWATAIRLDVAGGRDR